MRQLWFALVALVVVLSDQASKAWVTHSLPDGMPISVLPPVVYLLRTTNDGVAWSLFRHHADLFSLVALFFCLGVVIMGRQTIQRSRYMTLVLGLLVGGALGNLVDRVRMGYVVDFIDVHIGSWYRWPTFNLADSAITVGMILLAIRFGRSEAGQDAHATCDGAGDSVSP